MTTTPKRKLIEVALPLEAINRESAREKSIRHGHPSTLHLWWARRPLAACRAVLFAQLVDDPSSHPDRFPTEEAVAAERQRLFRLIERLVVWENTTDEALLREAHEEILKSTDGNPPQILDPFAGGGSIPLEAQRLGLKTHASDLNPIPVLINRALIEIPSEWTGRPPVFPGAKEEKLGKASNSDGMWPKAAGLAEDVRRYGQWIREETEKRIGHLYPKVELEGGGVASVIAWIWARTVRCPNPACGIDMPLVKSWWLGKKKGKEAYAVPKVKDGNVVFEIGHDVKHAPKRETDGTVRRTGAVCIGCGDTVPLAYIRSEGKEGRIGQQLMAVAAEGKRRRIYLAPSEEHEQAAQIPRPRNVPDTELPSAALGFRVQGYGMTHHADLFTNRQLAALTTFSDVVQEARRIIQQDAAVANDRVAADYARAVSVYLGFSFSRTIASMSNLNTWNSAPSKEGVNNLFKLQAISMVWDFAECNCFYEGPADILTSANWVARALDVLPLGDGRVTQISAAERSYSDVLVSTDPPYYDNVGYADLSDFFYVWLRRTLMLDFPSELGTMLTPKSQELVADPFRHGGDDAAGKFFEDGFFRVFSNLRRDSNVDCPIAVYYAFRQTEKTEHGHVSTGWETLLSGMISAGWSVVGTWPMRTERTGRPRDNEANALASSVVLVCKPRPDDAATATRRQFIADLSSQIPRALSELQQGAVRPGDLGQAAIGPGMAIFSSYSQVLESTGQPMSVHAALELINQALDEALSEQEGDFDPVTRFCVQWFREFGWNEDKYDQANNMARGRNTSIDRVERSGVFRARAGKARLLPFSELPADWSPDSDERISLWEVVLQLAKALDEEGGDAAARLMAAARIRVDMDVAQELAYLLFAICEKRGLAQDAMLFNGLGQSWADLTTASRKQAVSVPKPIQDGFTFDED